MLIWFGGALYRWRHIIPLVAFLIVCAAAFYGSTVFNDVRDTGLTDPNSASARAESLINAHFPSQSTDVVLLLKSSTLHVADPAFAQAAQQLSANLSAQHEVSSLTSYYSTHSDKFLSHDLHETFFLVNLVHDGVSLDSKYHALEPLLKAAPLEVYSGGSVVANIQFNDQLSHDLLSSEMIGLPIVAILLVIIFGGVIAALLPLLMGGIVIACAFAIVHGLTMITDVSSFATNVITLIGLGLAIDYSLFIITRFREELRSSSKPTPLLIQLALRKTIVTAGRTVLFSGLTVGTSLIALLLFSQSLLRSVGMAIIAVALVAMLATLIVLPAILALLGHRVNALSLSRFIRFVPSARENTTRGGWYWLSKWVMRWAVPVALVGIAFLLLLGIPFLHVSFALPDDRSLPTGTSSRFVADELRANFSNQVVTDVDIVAQTPGSALSSQNLAQLDTYVRHLQTLPHVSSIGSLVSLDAHLTLSMYQQMYAHPQANAEIQVASQQFANANITRVTVEAPLDAHSQAAHDLVTQIRKVAAPHGWNVLVGGETADEVDQLAELSATLPWALLVMMVAITVLLFLMTGSVVVPIKALLLNILSLSAIFGILVWIFQEGHLQNLLGFRAFGSLDATEPILIFAIAFGLSMDYEVFLLSRIKEQFDKTGDNRESVASGLQKTGWLITSAALLLAIVIGAFATSKIISIQEIGVGLALAILMDATLVRGLLVPAMMRLMGKWNWWAPAPLRALWRRIGLHEDAHVELLETKAVDKDEEDKELIGSGV
jgi:trehalose monomycolate/heme transporter